MTGAGTSFHPRSHGTAMGLDYYTADGTRTWDARTNMLSHHPAEWLVVGRIASL